MVEACIQEDDKDDEKKFLHWNLQGKVPVIVGGIDKLKRLN